MPDTFFSRPATLLRRPQGWAAAAAAAATLLLAIGSAVVGMAPAAEAGDGPATALSNPSATGGDAPSERPGHTASDSGAEAVGLPLSRERTIVRGRAGDPPGGGWGLAGGGALAALVAWRVRRKRHASNDDRSGADRDPENERRQPITEVATTFARWRGALEGPLDTVTGLPSRSALFRLEVELARIPASVEIELCVVCIDLDDFRTVNDRFGRAAGDAALRQVALRLRAAARDGDIVLRLGGDEFAVVAPCAAGAGDELAERIGTRLVEQMREPLTGFAPAGVVLGACIGTARWRPGPAALIESVRQAGEALLAAKRAGRCRLRHYTARRSLRSRPAEGAARAR